MTGDEGLQLVDDGLIALCRKDVHERLRAQDLPDRRGERRRADFGADSRHLLQHLVDAVARRVGAQMDVERGHETRWQAVLRSERCDAGRCRRHRLVADELIHEVRGFPDAGRVDARVETEAGERRGRRLGGDPMQHERQRIDGAGDEIRARPRSLESRGQRHAAGALAVEADGKTRASRTSPTRLAARCGLSEPDGSWMSTREAPSSGSLFACSASTSVSS